MNKQAIFLASAVSIRCYYLENCLSLYYNKCSKKKKKLLYGHKYELINTFKTEKKLLQNHYSTTCILLTHIFILQRSTTKTADKPQRRSSSDNENLNKCLREIWNKMTTFGEPRVVVSVIGAYNEQTSTYEWADISLLKEALNDVAKFAGSKLCQQFRYWTSWTSQV